MQLSVEYRGVRTEEEKDLERAEEQKVIEAKRRMQSESQTEERVVRAGEPQSLVELLPPPDDGPSSCDCLGEAVENVHVEYSEVQAEVDVSSDSNTCNTRHEELDVDLEEIMVMEAIWRSLQDSRLQRSDSSRICSPSEEENSSGTSLQPGHQGQGFLFCSLAEGVAIAIARLGKHNRAQPQISEPECETIETHGNLYENSIHVPNSTQPESEFSTGSELRIVGHPCRLARELNA